jgi:hypothetical protein
MPAAASSRQYYPSEPFEALLTHTDHPDRAAKEQPY